MSRGFRIILLVVLSIGAGIGGLYATLGGLNLLWNAGVNPEEYGMVFNVTTAVPVAALAFVWLDFFLGTGILPEGMLNREDND
ncbi:MAG: hypothetical protein GYB64_20640 [Chloroflexi bacterium]|nr:hypothetical protein [Chloroflexota bacterium]